MSDQFTLDVVQASELKYAVERNGGTNADLKALSSGDMFAKILPILRGYGKVVVELLQKLGEVAFPGAMNFVAKEKFKLKKDGGICSYLGTNFTTWFLDKTETNVVLSTIGYGKLLQNAKDAIIIAFLGGETRAETSLAEVFHLMSVQANGEAGVLLINGWANIFFVRDFSGVLRVVSVRWLGCGWVVHAREVTDPGAWSGGQVFSRNLILESSVTATAQA